MGRPSLKKNVRRLEMVIKFMFMALSPQLYQEKPVHRQKHSIKQAKPWLYVPSPHLAPQPQATAGHLRQFSEILNTHCLVGWAPAEHHQKRLSSSPQRCNGFLCAASSHTVHSAERVPGGYLTHWLSAGVGI